MRPFLRLGNEQKSCAGSEERDSDLVILISLQALNDMVGLHVNHILVDELLLSF